MTTVETSRGPLTIGQTVGVDYNPNLTGEIVGFGTNMFGQRTVKVQLTKPGGTTFPAVVNDEVIVPQLVLPADEGGK